MKTKLMLASALLLLPVTTIGESVTHAAEVSAIKGETDAAKYTKAIGKADKTVMTQSMVNQFNKGQLLNTKKLNLEFLKLVNQERKKSGAAPIAYNAKLQAGANLRASEQAAVGKISHTRPNGAQFNTAISPTSVRKTVKAENVLFTYYNFNPYTLVSEKYVAERMFNLWYKSPLHRQNMLNKQFKGTAIAFKYANVTGKKYTYGYGAQIINK